MDEAKVPSRMRSASPNKDADEFANPMHGLDLVRNRLENEARVKDVGESRAEIKPLSLSEGQREKAIEEEGLKILDRELAHAKVTTDRLALVVGSEWMRQWLEERRLLLGEMQQLRDKLAVAECTAKDERKLKEEYLQQLKLFQGTLRGDSTNKRSRQDEWSTSLESSPCELTGGSDSVSGRLYELLQKEVIALRKAGREIDRTLKDKDGVIEMLIKKVETLKEVIEIVRKKTRREPTVMEEDMHVEKEQENRANQFDNSKGSSSLLLPRRDEEEARWYRVPSSHGGEEYICTLKSQDELERSGLEFAIPVSCPKLPMYVGCFDHSSLD